MNENKNGREVCKERERERMEEMNGEEEREGRGWVETERRREVATADQSTDRLKTRVEPWQKEKIK